MSTAVWMLHNSPLSIVSEIVESSTYLYVSYLCIRLFILYGYMTKSQYDQLPVGLIAQFIELCTGLAEVMGLNPVEALIFRLSFRNFLSRY